MGIKFDCFCPRCEKYWTRLTQEGICFECEEKEKKIEKLVDKGIDSIEPVEKAKNDWWNK